MNKIKVGLATLALAGIATMGLSLPAQATENTEECIPSAAYSETIPGTPAVDAVYETVVVSEAGWQRYSYTGDWDQDVAPAFPGANWQANVAGDPQNIGVAGAYFVSNENSGHVDWFYLEAVAAVTQQVLVTAAVPATEDVVIDHPAVVCEPDVIPVTACESATVLPVSTNLNTHGWELEGGEYVDGGVALTASNWSDAYAYHAENFPLADAANLSINGGIAIIMTTSAGPGNVHYEPGVYTKDLWTNTPGVLPLSPGGQGGTYAGNLNELLSNPTVTGVYLYFSTGSTTPVTSLLTSGSFNCTVQSFDYEEAVVVPEQPSDNVVTSAWVDGEIICGDTTVEQSRTVSTTPYVLVENEWVAGETTVVTETQTRDLTSEEIAEHACPVVVVTPPKVTTPPAELPETLAYTGSDTAVPALGAIMFLAGGAGLMLLSRLRRRGL